MGVCDDGLDQYDNLSTTVGVYDSTSRRHVYVGLRRSHGCCLGLRKGECVLRRTSLHKSVWQGTPAAVRSVGEVIRAYNPEEARLPCSSHVTWQKTSSHLISNS